MGDGEVGVPSAHVASSADIQIQIRASFVTYIVQDFLVLPTQLCVSEPVH